MPLTIGPKFAAFLERKQLAIVTTLNQRGTPEMTPIWYVYEDDHIWFNGTTSRNWLKRMQTQGRATFFLIDGESPWRWAQVYGKIVEAKDDPGGVQFEGLSVRYGRPMKNAPDRRYLKIAITSVKGYNGNPQTGWDVS